MKICATILLLIGLLRTTRAVDWYVATNGTGLGTNGWAYATNNLQGAINISAVNDTIWVSNGVYDTGGVTNYPAATTLTNRIAIWKSVTVRSKDNDPTNTIIKGAWDAPSTTNGPAAVRCVFMASNSVLIGFTITNGATLLSSSVTTNKSGGGVYCPAVTTPVISNCIIAGNAASVYGGGSAYGTLRNCTLIGNSVGTQGGGAFFGNLYNCTLISNRTTDTAGSPCGGAAFGSGSALYMYNCVLTGNSSAYGGGTYYGFLYNCLLTRNYAASQGGGSFGSTLYNCTVVSNSASINGYAGGVYGANMRNCIVYYNTCPAGSNYYGTVTFIYSCTAPDPGGAGNITSDPSLLDKTGGNYRLSPRSPCINAGTNYSWMTDGSAASLDLDGNPRLRFGTADIGAYENYRSGVIYRFH